jgi:ribosome-associated protein
MTAREGVGKERMPQSPNQMALSQKQKKSDKTHDPERAAVRAKVKSDDSLKSAKLAAQAALEKKAEDVIVIDLRELSSYTDFLVICSGGSDRQLDAVADGVEAAMKEAGHGTVGFEGNRGGKWMLIDFGDVVLHVFHQDERAYYDLEGLWADAPRVTL